MPTIINNGDRDPDGSNWAVIGVVALVLAIIFFFVVLPALRNNVGEQDRTDINIEENRTVPPPDPAPAPLPEPDPPPVMDEPTPPGAPTTTP